jgi:hypothetical protein
MVTELYNLLWNFLFAGELPEVLSLIAPEVCTIITVVCICIVCAVPFFIIYGLIRAVFDFGRIGRN